MGIVYIKKLSENSKLGLWHVIETAKDLLKILDLSPVDTEIYQTKKDDKRRKEWLACRNLLKEMFKEKVNVHYNRNGKPHLEENNFQISMSHSGEYVCVYMDKINPVGVDIQKLKPSIEKGLGFFINQTERSWVEPKDNLLLHIIWSANESIFKYYDKNELDMKNDITLSSFKSNQNGVIEVSISNYDFKSTSQINYETFDDYVLTYTI